jgi:hypothetical protein
MPESVFEKPWAQFSLTASVLGLGAYLVRDAIHTTPKIIEAVRAVVPTAVATGTGIIALNTVTVIVMASVSVVSVAATIFVGKRVVEAVSAKPKPYIVAFCVFLSPLFADLCKDLFAEHLTWGANYTKLIIGGSFAALFLIAHALWQIGKLVTKILATAIYLLPPIITLCLLLSPPSAGSEMAHSPHYATSAWIGLVGFLILALAGVAINASGMEE